MKKIVQTSLLVILLTGCQFVSNPLYSTETETIDAFLEALTTNDDKKINQLTNLSREEKEKVFSMITEQKLENSNDKSCQYYKDDEFYKAYCSTADDKQLWLKFSLVEKKKGFMIDDFHYEERYTITFRDDHSKLTKNLIDEVEDKIGKISRLNNKDRAKLNRDLYNLAEVMRQVLYLQTDELNNHLDHDWIDLIHDSSNNTGFIEYQLGEFKGYNKETNIDLTRIEVSSYYDLLELHKVHTEDYHEFNKEYMENLYIVQFNYVVGDESEEVITIELNMNENNELKIRDFSLRPAPFDRVTFYLPEQINERYVHVDDVLDIYKNNCAACHASDLTGSVGPGLEEVGSKYSEDELIEIITLGMGAMPPLPYVLDEEAEVLAKWLIENYQ